jgi:hypothetical protein
MKRIAEFVGGPALVWTKPDWRTLRYELHHGGEHVASLGFRNAAGSTATGESEDGCWTFKRTGFWQTRVTVRQSGSNDDVGVVDLGVWTSGGALALPDDRRYALAANLWTTHFTISTESEEPLVQYRLEVDALQLSSVMEIQPRARAIEEIPWMVMLGWYIVSQLHRDSALRGIGSRRREGATT